MNTIQYKIADRNNLPATSLIRRKYHPSLAMNRRHLVKLRTKGKQGRLIWTTQNIGQCQCNCVEYSYKNQWYSYITSNGAQKHIAKFIAEHTA